MFPLDQIEAVQAAPEDYRLLARIPWTKESVQFPLMVREPVGDEVPVIVLDVETTGFEATDKIIELGLVKAKISPSTGQVTTLIAAVSLYEDPGFAIPELITDITGITDAMVAGQVFDESAIIQWFDDDPVVVAHNAAFDCGFIQRRFPRLNLRWACSIKDIPWRELGYEGNKLEYLCLKRNGFYEGHRASIDCLALAWLLNEVPAATRALLANEQKTTVKVEAVGSPFECKEALKARGYRWNPDGKVWHTEIAGDDLPEECSWLSMLYPSGGDRARKTERTSRERYLPEIG